MAKNLHLLLRCVLSVAVIFTGLDSAKCAVIDVIPNGFIEAVTEAVFVTCSPDGTGARAKEILIIEISKDGATPIVRIQPPDRIQYGVVPVEHYRAHGIANNSAIASSYLNLTIIYPSEEDAGTYECVMSYIDETGMVKQDTAQADLKLNASDNSNLENRVKILETALDNLIERVEDVEKDNLQLQLENRNQTSQIQTLKERADYIVAFSAAITDDKRVATGDVLVFSDVMLNEGQGYNSTSGVFTAPRAGLYAFHLVLEIGQAGAIGEINLQVAGKNVSKMYTQDKDFGDQGAISNVCNLQVGDTVMVVVYLASGNNPRVFAERLSVFSGYLIKT